MIKVKVEIMRKTF